MPADHAETGRTGKELVNLFTGPVRVRHMASRLQGASKALSSRRPAGNHGGEFAQRRGWSL